MTVIPINKDPESLQVLFNVILQENKSDVKGIVIIFDENDVAKVYVNCHNMHKAFAGAILLKEAIADFDRIS